MGAKMFAENSHNTKDRGTRLHKLAELFLLTHEEPTEVSADIQGFWQSLVRSFGFGFDSFRGKL